MLSQQLLTPTHTHTHTPKASIYGDLNLGLWGWGGGGGGYLRQTSSGKQDCLITPTERMRTCAEADAHGLTHASALFSGEGQVPPSQVSSNERPLSTCRSGSESPQRTPVAPRLAPPPHLRPPVLPCCFKLRGGNVFRAANPKFRPRPAHRSLQRLGTKAPLEPEHCPIPRSIFPL